MSVKTKWVEAGSVQLHDEIILKRQHVTVTNIVQVGEGIILQGETEDGEVLEYRDYVDSVVQKVVQDA